VTPPLLLVLGLLCAAGSCLAQSLFVSDQLEITLRKGESERHKIIRMLPSGMPLEVLKTNEQSGYSRVRTREGAEGFVLTRFLTEEPPARNRLAAMETRLRELQQSPDQLAAQLSEVQSRHEQLTGDYERLEREKENLEEELATIRYASANVVQITNERSELRKSLADLTREAAIVRQENDDLKTQTSHRWFLIGAGVLAGGILIGLILPHLRLRRRKSSWGSM